MPPPGPKPPPNKLVAIGAVVVLAGFLLPQLLPTSTAPTAQPTDAPNYAGFLVKMLLGLAALAAACVALVRWKKPTPAVAGNMHILATVPVGRGLVHLVRAGDRRLLIGVDLGGVKAIAELPGPLPAEAA
jgi:flagellar biogenesis protein FliO